MTAPVVTVCWLCSTILRPVMNIVTRQKSGVWACEHCDNVCVGGRFCTLCQRASFSTR